MLCVFVATQPTKAGSGDSTAKQIQTYQKHDSTDNTTKKAFPTGGAEFVTFARDNQYKSSKDTCKPTDSKSDSSNWWIVGFTCILALASIYQAFRSHRDSQMELRAYISVIPIIPFVRLTDGIFEPFKFIIKNEGQTPAHNVRGYWHVGANYPAKMSFDVEHPITFGTPTLNKGGEYKVETPPHKIEPPEDVQKIINGEASLFVFGAILYDDAFGKPHTTPIRTEIRGKDGGFSDPIVMLEGNQAT